MNAAMDATGECGQIWITQSSTQRQVHKSAAGTWMTARPDEYLAADLEGNLEKSVNTFAKKLEKAGHSVEVTVHRSGTITGCDAQRVSRVELAVNHNTVRFLANGYCETSSRDIGGLDMTWTEMKQKAVSKLNLEAR